MLTPEEWYKQNSIRNSNLSQTIAEENQSLLNQAIAKESQLSLLVYRLIPIRVEDLHVILHPLSSSESIKAFSLLLALRGFNWEYRNCFTAIVVYPKENK